MSCERSHPRNEATHIRRRGAIGIEKQRVIRLTKETEIKSVHEIRATSNETRALIYKVAKAAK